MKARIPHERRTLAGCVALTGCQDGLGGALRSGPVWFDLWGL